jgi:protein-tyrosine phosphatase
MISILFVCLGNICRSPAAEGVLIHLAKQNNPPMDIYVESCGLGSWHKGQLPDERMRIAAKARGIVLTSRAQPFHPDFFEKFDYILAADNSVMYELHKWAKIPEHKAKIHLITRFSPSYYNQEVPDPYYYGQAHFEQVLDMLEDSCRGILDHILKLEENG